MVASLYHPLNEYIGQIWPDGLLDLPPVDQMRDIWIEAPVVQTDPTFQARAGLLFKNELPLRVPGVQGLAVVFRAASDEQACLLEIDSQPVTMLRVAKASLA